MLEMALNGVSKPHWQSDEDFSQLNTVPVYSWPIHASEHVFDPKLTSLDESSDVEVNGQFSKDLDLFYKAEDAENLFSIETNTYQEICTLAIDMLIIKSTDETKFNELSEKLTATNVFNYLSEEQAVRDTLYYVCLFSRFEDESRQRVLHENRDAFNTLF
jgi:hypothetical protein